MTFIGKQHIKLGIAISLILGMGATSFAGNTISDVPASASEMREIERTTTLYDGSCDIEQDLAFYDKSPVYLRVGQPKSTVNYVFDKTETYVIVYNQQLFAGNLRFPYVSNFVPSTSFEPDSSNILTVEATGSTFSGGTMTMDRDEIAGQIITKNMERAALVNSAGATLNYYYKLANINFTPKSGTVKINIHPNLTPKTSCTNYYIARCGDGVLDNASTDGIEVDGDTIERHSRSLEPNEACDEGELNGTPGHCKSDCTGMGSGTTPTGGATCTITATPSTIEAGQTVTINAGYTSGQNPTFSPAISGFVAPFSSPTWNGTATETPTTTTTYTMNVEGANGLSGTSCSTTVTVNQPEPHLQCTITFSPSIAGTGQVVNVGWNVSNGNFFGTYIYVTPPTLGARPHRVNANQYNGVTSMMPTQTGQYVFTMMVQNNEEQATCTGILNVIDNISPCTLTTTTPTISAGQTAILQGSYSNGVLATITPSIPGLNFVYPNRSNTNIPVAPTSTTTYTMNVLGALGGSGVSCSTTVHVINTGLTLSKQLTTNVLYHSGDIVTFKINFANNSATTINNIVITDYLPLSLEYVTSQIFGITPPYGFATGFFGGNASIEYSGFNLAPGQQGYILLQGRFKGYQYADQTLNNAFAKGDDTQTVYASALFYVYAPGANATITKTSNKASYFPGEDIGFTLAVTNNGPDTINSITLTDNRPDGGCITLDPIYTSVNGYFSGAVFTDPYQWIYTGSLTIGQTIYLHLTGHISNAPTCVGTYVNNANISYVVNGETKTGNAQALSFIVSTTPSSTMNFEKRLIQYGSNSGDPVVFELIYRNNGSATITNFDIVDYRPGTLNFVSASPMPTTQITTPGGKEMHRYFTTPLAPNGSGKITINGTIQ